MRYACYASAVETISHRELRNSSGAVLERVRNGETIAVTNHGQVTAILIPPVEDTLAALRAAGRLREPTTSGPLGPRSRARRPITTDQVLDDLRGPR